MEVRVYFHHGPLMLTQMNGCISCSYEGTTNELSQIYEPVPLGPTQQTLNSGPNWRRRCDLPILYLNWSSISGGRIKQVGWMNDFDMISLTCYNKGPDFVMAIINGFDRAMIPLMGCMFSESPPQSTPYQVVITWTNLVTHSFPHCGTPQVGVYSKYRPCQSLTHWEDSSLAPRRFPSLIHPPRKHRSGWFKLPTGQPKHHLIVLHLLDVKLALQWVYHLILVCTPKY